MYNIWLATHYLTIAYTKVLKTKMKQSAHPVAGRQGTDRCIPRKRKRVKLFTKLFKKKKRASILTGWGGRSGETGWAAGHPHLNRESGPERSSSSGQTSSGQTGWGGQLRLG